MTPILNPEPGRFICRGPGAKANAMTLATFQRDQGLTALILFAESVIGSDQNPKSPANRSAQNLIADADIIIDVIP